MALTKEDLQAIAQLTRTVVKEELEPVNKRLDGVDKRLDTMQTDIEALKEDVEQIKEHTEVTREATNTLVEWTEAAADVLKLNHYRLKPVGSESRLKPPKVR